MLPERRGCYTSLPLFEGNTVPVIYNAMDPLNREQTGTYVEYCYEIFTKHVFSHASV